MNKRYITWSLLAFSLMMFAAGCKKKTPPPPPPPPPPPKEAPAPAPAPASAKVDKFTVEPSSIQRGQSATLTWVVQDATIVGIDNGIGEVQASGHRQVFPSNSTTYMLTAKGPGGTVSASASVTVTAPPAPPPPPAAQPKRSLTERLTSDVQDVFFDYDKYDVREDARSTLSRNSDALKTILRDFPNAVISVEGHCDERGSAEYNLGLGDRRSTSARDFLVQLGVPADRLRTVSYGKERPQCTEGTEDCWQKNRRSHFSAGQ
ncbi:MAG: OmpA family protein [Acidobacteriia bacterium]|nr:OmpA family protein [Terriglobia bacterium]